jgi:hypothetical protein
LYLRACLPLLLGAACLAQQAAGPLESAPKLAAQAQPAAAQAQPAAAQQKPPAEKPEPAELKITVTAGEGAVNNIRAHVAAQPVVQVKDEKDQPVPGAEVVFQLPPTGPGGVFYGWLKTQTVRTDANGEARAAGFAPNEEAGKFTIRVLAAVGSKTATATINQSNGQGPGGAQAKSGHKGLWITLGVVAAGAIIGGVVAATNGGSTTTTTVPITITGGPVTVGGPR